MCDEWPRFPWSQSQNLKPPSRPASAVDHRHTSGSSATSRTIPIVRGAVLKAPCQSARCVPCPKCGVWVVIQVGTEERKIDHKDKHRTPTTSRMLCPKCAQAFDVEDKDTRVFRVEPHIFERMCFYPSELSEDQKN